MSTIPITPGQLPKAGKIQLDPSSGRYQFFDPGYGQQGQFRQASLAELQAEKARDPSFNLPFNYGAFGETPEGKVRTRDPNTGLLVFTDPVPDPAAMSPEQLQRASNIAALGDFIDPQTGQIRDEFAGGDLPTIDVIRDQDPATLAQTIEGLKNRQKGRLTGFKGEFTDLSGGEALEAFQGAVGTRAGYVDPYGQKTQIGMQEDLFKDPQSAMIQGTFDEQKYLRDYPDVAAAVMRGDFASGKEHFDTFGKQEQRDVYYKGGTVLDLEEIQTSPDEFLDSTKYNINPTTGQFTATVGTTADVAMPTKTDAQSFTADKSFADVQKEAMKAAKQQGLTDIVTAQTDTVDKESTVQGQLEGLMAQFEDGKIPAFAAGAIRTAEQRLAARGMGASSMAGAAIVQAAMEAATPIAAADAATYSRMQQLNLNNRQQAEVLNAQMTMRLDLANLNNEQQARITNTANRVQALFRDQAAVNASKQFNAANEQQNDQFFASLSNNAAQFKAAQQNAMERFNAGQKNAVEQFNASLQNTREQFNQKNAILIDQANAVYRRNVNTANTALRNAENEFNVRNLFNISQTALNNLLQEDKDKVNFARVNSLNDTAFKNQLALSSFAFDRNLETSKEIARGAQQTRLINTVVGGVVDFVFS
tara:strand:+ start:233 stop:2173 length:1941 start_codon:yes stop_codon:yes gene_type:complete